MSVSTFHSSFSFAVIQATPPDPSALLRESVHNSELELTSGWLSQQMPDLDTESPYVVRTLHAWIHDLVKKYNVDALRIDTVKHIRKDFWPDFVRSAGVAAMGEVLHGGECTVSLLTPSLVITKATYA